jgi:hypothetical protein
MTLGSPILFTKVRILFGFRCYGLNYNFMVNFDDHSFKIIWEIRIHFYKPSFFFLIEVMWRRDLVLIHTT